METAVTTGDWSDPCFVKAGEDFQKLIDLEPFQEGFLAAPWDGAGSSAAAQATNNGAIQLMGQWLPGTVQANSGGAREMGEGLGWFPFPGVDGAAGDPFDGARWRQRLRRGQGRAARDGRLPASTSSASTRRTAGAR